ncbi:LAGLIDADG family homing endonuclease [Haloarcula salina]|uniref:DOD-type homing endonuclease domain-containing protein n=1 Tax=Haloarcula salina TaxID=1429914 RepID=A0AA41KH47_9EURY|nr:LAGLIDADG family homing endonuclease [Haloarcula salina]MBV0901361.1 hypothetical protein [Haloarcula salina]
MIGRGDIGTRVSNSNQTKISDGGFTADTEVLTADGPIQVAELGTTDRVLALNPTTKVVKPKSVVDVMVLNPPEEIISIKIRRSDIRVLPDHQIPYTTKGISYPRFTRAAELLDREYYRFINSWRDLDGTRLPQVDITDIVSEFEACVAFDCHGHTVRRILPDGCEPCRRNSHYGYFFDKETFQTYQNELEALGESVEIHAGRNHWRRPYRFDGDDFIEFLGWYITEGSVTWRRTNSATIQIAQKTPEHREQIENLLERMGLSEYSDDRSFSFSSTIYAELLDQLCGIGSENMHLPEFLWDCSAEQKRLMLRTLVAGDGHERGAYSTVSKRLVNDIVRLLVELGIKPQYHWCRDSWRVSLSRMEDGFRSSQNVSTVQTDNPVYRLTIEDFCLIMAGRNGKFQWIGVSNVN